MGETLVPLSVCTVINLALHLEECFLFRHSEGRSPEESKNHAVYYKGFFAALRMTEGFFAALRMTEGFFAALRMTERFFAALRMTGPPLCHPEESRLCRDDEGSRRTLFEILPLRQAQGKAFAKDAMSATVSL